MATLRCCHRRSFHVGSFATQAAAAAAYDRAALKLLGAGAATNAPAAAYPPAAVEAALLAVRPLHKVKGVVMRATAQQVQWHVQVCTNSVTYKLGYVGSREQAARVYDAVLLHCGHPSAEQLCNYPPEAYSAHQVRAELQALSATHTEKLALFAQAWARKAG